MTNHRVLLVSDRAAAPPFFECLARRQSPSSEWPFALTPIPADAGALARHAGEVGRAAVALVDVYPTPEAALRVCRALRTRWPALPLLALLGCPWAAGPETLRALRAAGVGLSGAHATPEQLLADIQSVVRGEDVLWMSVRPHRGWARPISSAEAPPHGPRPRPLRH